MDTTKKIIQKLIKIAENHQEIIQKLAQQASAQAGDIQVALQKNNLWELSGNIAPLLNQAGVSEDASVAISIVVDKGPTLKYGVVLTPPNAGVANKLSALINSHYGAPMVKAIRGSNLTIETPITLNWLKF